MYTRIYDREEYFISGSSKGFHIQIVGFWGGAKCASLRRAGPSCLKH